MKNDREFKHDPRIALIPTPEEEALEDHRKAANKHGNRMLFALIITGIVMWFRDDIERGARAVWELFA
jgi:hypothetical protein